MILPCSPEPFIVDKSKPFSFANFLANGEANILVFEEVTSVTGAAGAAEAGAAAGASLFTSTASLEATGAAGAGAAAPLKTADTSVPAGPMIASTESTGADPPSSIPICNKVPV